VEGTHLAPTSSSISSSIFPACQKSDLVIISHKSFLRFTFNQEQWLFIQLPQNQYHLVRPLFTTLNYHLIIEAVITGNSPATIFVDNLEHSTTAFMKSPEGDFLGGLSDNTAFNRGMQNWIEEHFINGEEDEVVFESCAEDWTAAIQTILEKRPPLAYERYYYEITEPKLTPPPLAPEFTLQLVTQDFITQEHIQNMEAITGAIESNWTSPALFFEKGFGLCIVHENTIVSWSVVDCVVDNRCEIGIHTAPEFQRRGLATTLVAAVVDYAFAQGFKQIGWHCWVDNGGSIGVAEKVGLFQKHRYIGYISLHSQLINYAFQGYKRLQVQDYLNAEPAYIKAIASVDDESRYFLPRVHYEMARVQGGLGQDDAALKAMQEALLVGFKYTVDRLAVPEFARLQDNPAWQALFVKQAP
jgi:RimJ/RimL family protein N-acetyltransferase